MLCITPARHKHASPKVIRRVSGSQVWLQKKYWEIKEPSIPQVTCIQFTGQATEHFFTSCPPLLNCFYLKPCTWPRISLSRLVFTVAILTTRLTIPFRYRIKLRTTVWFSCRSRRVQIRNRSTRLHISTRPRSTLSANICLSLGEEFCSKYLCIIPCWKWKCSCIFVWDWLNTPFVRSH